MELITLLALYNYTTLNWIIVFSWFRRIAMQFHNIQQIFATQIVIWSNKFTKNEIKVSPSVKLMVKYSRRIYANMSVLIIITINNFETGRLQAKANLMHIPDRPGWIEVFESRTPMNDCIVNAFALGQELKKKKKFSIEDNSTPSQKNGNVSTYFAKDTESVSWYWFFSSLLFFQLKEQRLWMDSMWHSTKKKKKKKHLYVFHFCFLLLLSFLRNDTGRCGIKAQSVNYCLISSAIRTMAEFWMNPNSTCSHWVGAELTFNAQRKWAIRHT